MPVDFAQFPGMICHINCLPKSLPNPFEDTNIVEIYVYFARPWTTLFCK